MLVCVDRDAICYVAHFYNITGTSNQLKTPKPGNILMVLVVAMCPYSTDEHSNGNIASETFTITERTFSPKIYVPAMQGKHVFPLKMS